MGFDLTCKQHFLYNYHEIAICHAEKSVQMYHDEKKMEKITADL